MKKNKDPEKEAGGIPALQGTPRLPVAVEQEVLRFMDFHSPDRFQKNLRRMLLDFLMYQGSLEAVYLRELVEDLDGLFELLDVMESASQTSRAET
ncbi:MAG: hypothetical protein LOY03_01875 [Cyclobacteriaceae bacterium]|jgi:hypothetical protein|nr:hypothetical protein [Cyclobacteriaceae bacterium]